MLFDMLDDSPMFRKQIQSVEESAELVRERSLRFYKGCRKYTEGLGEGYDGDIAFASALEMFGGGHNDHISAAFGGSVMTKFTIALREIGTYKEILRSQVETKLNDRLLQFVDVNLLEVKEARKRFDKASLIYHQAREKFLSPRKSTKSDIATVLEEELHNARSTFEQARFNLVTALSNVEAKKRFEFLEAVSGTEYLDGCTPLHLACEAADIGMLELLLQYGANINATDPRAQTPLHRCILLGKAASARLLLTRGADPHALNMEGKTPLELAVESDFRDSEVLALLSGANR